MFHIENLEPNQKWTYSLIFTYSKSTIETLEKDVKYVQSQQYKHQNDATDVVLVFLLLTLNIFHTFFSVSYVDFEQVNFVSWVPSSKLN